MLLLIFAVTFFVSWQPFCDYASYSFSVLTFTSVTPEFKWAWSNNFCALFRSWLQVTKGTGPLFLLSRIQSKPLRFFSSSKLKHVKNRNEYCGKSLSLFRYEIGRLAKLLLECTATLKFSNKSFKKDRNRRRKIDTNCKLVQVAREKSQSWWRHTHTRQF